MGKYEVVSCSRLGTDVRPHPQAKITQSIHEELNEEGGFTFTVPLGDPNIDWLSPIKREVQVYRPGGSIPIAWGVILRAPDIDLNVREVEVAGLFHYFKRLHFGKANRANALVNGSFDDNPSSPVGWTLQGVTGNVVDQWGMRPGATRQLNLYQAGSGLDTFATQTIADSVGGHYWTISADFHIRTDSAWVGPAFENRGLYVERLSPDGQTIEEVQSFAITDDTPRGMYQHATIGISTPPGRGSYLRVRLYATRCTNATPSAGRPPGSIIWDNVKATLMESLSFPLADVGSIANQIVQHAQNPDYGKANLNIAAGSPTIGIQVQRHYQYADHPNIGDALQDLAQQGVCDFGFTWSSPTQRSFRVYGPQAGAVRTDLVLELGSAVGIKEVPRIERDGSKAATAVVVLSEGGSGPDRDEASSIDASATDGVVLEEIINSAEDHDILYQVSEIELARRRFIPEVPEVVASPDLIGRVNIGDTLPMVIRRGAVNIDKPYRIVATDLDPDIDRFQLTLNPVLP